MWSACLIPFFFIPGAFQTHHTNSALTCVNDYLTNISCEWKNASWPPDQICNLQATRNTFLGDVISTCDLNTRRRCWIDFETLPFSFAERIHLKVSCKNTQVYELRYRPGHHVKLRPPEQLRVTGANVTWSRGARFPHNIKQYVFELQIKANGQRWEDVSPRLVDGTCVSLDDDSLCVSGECEARVRVKPVDSKDLSLIQGQWSDWSSTVSWTSTVLQTTSREDPLTRFKTGVLVGFVVLIVTVVVPVIFYIYGSNCLWKAGHIPDPSKYFQPLINKHKGNFQQWLGVQHLAPVFLPPQSCDCEISPVDEISEVWDDGLCSQTVFACGNQRMSVSSGLSSGISNMGYFYSEDQTGLLCLDSCPVYFTYHPEEGPVRSTPTYERLKEDDPMSPKPSFGTEAKRDEDEEDEEAAMGPKDGVNVKHLVSFFSTLPETTRNDPPPDVEEAEPPESCVPSKQPDDLVTRPSSMVLQPCGSGYLTLKEMQKYSNKSI